MVSHGSVRGLCRRRILRSLNVTHIVHFQTNDDIVSLNAKKKFPKVPLTVLFPSAGFRLISDVNGGMHITARMTGTVKLGGIAFHRTQTRRRGRAFSFIIDHTIVPLTSLVGVVQGGVSPGRRGTLPGKLVYLGKNRLRRRTVPFGRGADVRGLGRSFSRRFFRAGGIMCMAVWAVGRRDRRGWRV